MAKQVGGLMGHVIGKIGGSVGSNWKGIPTYREYNPSPANPQTAAQTVQRATFANTVALARLLLADLIATFWDPFARKMSGYNHFIQINISSFDENGLDSPSTFFASRGILTGVENIAAAVVEDTSVQVTWDDNSGQGDALITDYMTIVYWNETQDYWKFTTNPAKGRDGASSTVADSEVKDADDIHIYAFFSRPDLSKISDSVYLEVEGS